MDLIRACYTIGSTFEGTLEDTALDMDLVDLEENCRGVLHLVFDLDKQQIYFEPGPLITETLITDLNICVVPGGNRNQIFFSRRILKKSVKPENYLSLFINDSRYSLTLTDALGELENDSEFNTCIKKMEQKKLIEIKRDSKVKLKDPGRSPNPGKGVYIHENQPNLTELLNQFRNQGENLGAYCCVATILRENGEDLYLSTIPAVRQAVLEQLIGKKSSASNKPHCHMCKQPADCNYPSGNKKNLLNMFTHTDLYLAYNLDPGSFEAMYQLCENCRTKVLAGADMLQEHSYHVANIGSGNKVIKLNCWIIPEGTSTSTLDMRFDYERLSTNTKKLLGIIPDVERILDGQTDDDYMVSFIFYSTTQKGPLLAGSVEDVPVLKITQARLALDDIARAYLQNGGASLVSLAKVLKSSQDINVFIGVYQTLFNGYKIYKDVLLDLYRNQIINELKNLYKGETSVERFKSLAGAYAVQGIMFLHLLNDMGCLIQPAFLKQLKGSGVLKPDTLYLSMVDDYLDERGYTADQKCMFYLGQLLAEVVRAQKSKQSNILQAIRLTDFKLENIPEIFTLVVNKLREYDLLNAPWIKILMSRFSFNYQSMQKNPTITPSEAIIFMMGGFGTFVAGDPSEKNQANSKDSEDSGENSSEPEIKEE